MRKIMAIILALCMVFALCACTASLDEATLAKLDDLSERVDSLESALAEQAEAAEEIVEEVAEEVEEVVKEKRDVDFVAGIVPSTDIAILVQMMDYLKANLEPQGIEFQLEGAMFEVANYITQLENFVTMGADVVVMVPMDTAAIQDACLAAEEAGTHVVLVSSPPAYGDNISGGIYSDYYEVGHLTGEMACAWAKEHYPDATEIGISCALAESDTDSIARTTGIRDAIEADDVCYISYEGFNKTTADDGYAFAEETMTAQPDTRIILMYESDPAIGVDNYFKAYVQSDSSLSLSDFAVFAVGASPSALELVESAKNDESSFRGIGCYAALEPGEPVLEVVNAIINGDDLPYWKVEDCFTVNSFGFGG